MNNQEEQANLNNDFGKISEMIKGMVKQTQLDIMMNANAKLVNLYFNIGKTLEENSNWGNKFIDIVAFELKQAFPNLTGFSIRNLKYMKTFYNEYKNDNEFVHLGAQIPWKHNLTLIQKVKNKSIRKWYMRRCLEEGWSRSILIYQIDTNLYIRQVKNIKHNNFKLTMKENSDLANYMMKDPYVFDLIELQENYKEKELENKMLDKLKKVLLELGSGFSFVGNQYKVTVDHQDFYIDLLFYHIHLKCYVAIELKVNEFKPEYAGKMSFYLTALDNQLKRENDNPSVGIILCQNKNNKVVDYTLKYINKPVGISEYKILSKMQTEMLQALTMEDNK